MSDLVHLPRGYFNDNDPVPCWLATVTGEDRHPCKPIVKCKCGIIVSLDSHHVHADGRITNSFLHDKPQPEACGWHVFLILDDWIGLEFLPDKDQPQ
jgi:hypothetical protein